MSNKKFFFSTWKCVGVGEGVRSGMDLTNSDNPWFEIAKILADNSYLCSCYSTFEHNWPAIGSWLLPATFCVAFRDYANLIAFDDGFPMNPNYSTMMTLSSGAFSARRRCRDRCHQNLSLECHKIDDASRVPFFASSKLVLSSPRPSPAEAELVVPFAVIQLFCPLCLERPKHKIVIHRRTQMFVCFRFSHCLFSSSCIFFLSFSLGLLVEGPPTVDLEMPTCDGNG